MQWISQPWPWYIGGPAIGITIPLVLLLIGKPFGLSSSFRHLCSICFPGTKASYLRDDDWRAESWNLLFVAGILAGSYLAAHYLSSPPPQLLPEHYRGTGGAAALFGGGALVGFGTRYADGCTSGHSLMGLSNLKASSLAATLSFFAGGLLMVGLGHLL